MFETRFFHSGRQVGGFCMHVCCLNVNWTHIKAYFHNAVYVS